MYVLRWFGDDGEQTVAGSPSSILALTHILEREQIAFKVAAAGGASFGQNEIGRGGYEFWLDRNQSFPIREGKL
jgi:hypothetical protein